MLFLISGSWVQMEARFLLPFLKETAEFLAKRPKNSSAASQLQGWSEVPPLRRKLPGFETHTRYGPHGGSHTYLTTPWVRKQAMKANYAPGRTWKAQEETPKQSICCEEPKWGPLSRTKYYARAPVHQTTRSGQRLTRKTARDKKNALRQ